MGLCSTHVPESNDCAATCSTNYIWSKIDTTTFEAVPFPLETHANWYQSSLLLCEDRLLCLGEDPDIEHHTAIYAALLDCPDTPTPRLRKDLARMDLRQPSHNIVFRTADGESLHFDLRVLVERSAYFRDMFKADCREVSTGEVDLRSDPQCTKDV